MPTVLHCHHLLKRILVTSLALRLFNLNAPILARIVVSGTVMRNDVSALGIVLVTLFAVTIFRTLLNVLQLFAFARATQQLSLDLSTRIFQRLVRLPLTCFRTHQMKSAITQIRRVRGVHRFLAKATLAIILSTVFIIICLILVLYCGIALATITLTMVPLFAILVLASAPVLQH